MHVCVCVREREAKGEGMNGKEDIKTKSIVGIHSICYLESMCQDDGMWNFHLSRQCTLVQPV